MHSVTFLSFSYATNLFTGMSSLGAGEGIGEGVAEGTSELTTLVGNTEFAANAGKLKKKNRYIPLSE